jgi:hypothetical protein
VLLDSIRSSIATVFVLDNLLAALVEIDVEEDQLLNPWHIEDTL